MVSAEPRVDSVVQRLLDNFDHHDPALDHDALEGVYRRLASECPVSHSDAHGGFTVVASYDDIVYIEKTCSVFSSAEGVLHPASGHGRSIPIEFDPPEHTAYRRLFMDVLSAPQVRRIEPNLRELTDRLLDTYLAGSDPDFIQHVAVQLPIRAVGNLLGLGESEAERAQTFGETVLENFGQPKMLEAMQKLDAFARATFDDRRANPRDDYLTKLVQTDFDGRALTDDELSNILRTFFFAGFETTARAIGSIVHHLAVDADLQQQIREWPELINAALEEGLRMLPPVTTMFRTVTEPVALGGEDLSAGDKLVLMFGAANRDPSKFETPNDFRVDRENVRPHLSFGIGNHYCAGAPLARAEIRILLEALAARPPFRLEGEPHWLPRLMMGQVMGIDYLPLRFLEV